MRIVFDLQACQTRASRGRGVGRYAEALVRHYARDCTDDVRICLNGNLPVDPVVRAFEGRVAPAHFSTYRYPPVSGDAGGEERAAAHRAAGALIRRQWLALQPDVLHVAHLFEGQAEDAVVPPVLPSVPGVLCTATLYDLIPLRYPEHYLAQPAARAWYAERLGILRQVDHLLAISESTRRDAIDLIGIDPSRVTTIHGGADARFAPRRITPEARAAFCARFDLTGRFVLYTGGDDFRKNLAGALAGYALLPADLRRNLQLVYVCAMSETTRATLRSQARSSGLRRDEVVFTGYVDDDDLVTFYNLCEVFVFPSLYEGFGLPVLEAMQCGAAVLGADNSSIAEIVGRPDALFESHAPEQLAARLAQVLTDANLRQVLSEHGLARAAGYGWARTARLAREAMQEAHAAAHRAVRASGARVGKRRRLAMFTPLPPCRSGVADYNAIFLPFLLRHFDIDLYIDDYDVEDAFLAANCAIRPHRLFDVHAAEYDAVIYEVGNSEFHAYMLDYLARHPGVVVLHDAYLSGLYWYCDAHLSDPGRLMREMVHSHGSRARRYYAPVQALADAAGRAMVDLPATRSVIEQAVGIISHSPFNATTAATHYPEGWAAPYRVVKQIARQRRGLSAEERAAARAALGFGEHDVLVCTFGHIVWTKCGDMLLEAFRRSGFGSDASARLLYVGELAADEFGHGLKRSIAASRLADRVRVTGYVDEARYEQYLAVADLAVQLRIHSRGGTPKGVLDCLAQGVPVIVNNDASYEDYPEDVVLKLPAQPSVERLLELFDQLREDPRRAKDLRERARDYARREHGGEQVAAEFAVVVDEFIARRRAVALPSLFDELGGILAPVHADDLAEPLAHALHANLAMPLFQRRRVLVDVSHISAGDHATGIQRVVRSVVRWLYCSARAGVEVVAVRLEGEHLVEASEWLDAGGLRTAVERAAGSGSAVEPRWGDTLLMLDSSWARYGEFAPVFERVRALQGRIWTAVYDLLPLRLPQCWPPGAMEWFRGWIEAALRHSDALVCISRTVADEVVALIEQGTLPRGRVRQVGYWHLGCDALPGGGEEEAPMTDRVAAATASRRMLLMVGTIEPRKNHALVLDAFEQLWAAGADVSLCIAGKQGWLVETLMERLQSHPERGRRLHQLDAPSDAELQQCYRRAAGLLFASSGEGFGLPLMEAAHAGLPILASDLPVLREVAGEHARYFALGPASGLAEAIRGWLADWDAGRVPSSRAIEPLSWEQSAEQLLDCVLEGRSLRDITAPSASQE